MPKRHLENPDNSIAKKTRGGAREDFFQYVEDFISQKTADSLEIESIDLGLSKSLESAYLELTPEEKVFAQVDWSLKNNSYLEYQGDDKPTVADVSAVFKKIYPTLSDSKKEEFKKRFGEDGDFCGLPLKPYEIKASLAELVLENSKEGEVIEDFGIKAEKISAGTSISTQAMLVLTTALGFLQQVAAAGVPCENDPNSDCSTNPPTAFPSSAPSSGSPTGLPSSSPTAFRSLSPSMLSTLMPTLSAIVIGTEAPTGWPSGSPTEEPTWSSTGIGNIKRDQSGLWEEEKPWVFLLSAGVAITVIGCAICCCCLNKGKPAAVGIDDKEDGLRAVALSGVRLPEELGHRV